MTAVMEILTAPHEASFYQQEEIDLAKSKNLELHAKKYFWLENSYNGNNLPFNGIKCQISGKVD